MKIELKNLPCLLLNEEVRGLFSKPIERVLTIPVKVRTEEDGDFTIEDIMCPYVLKKRDTPFYCPIRAKQYGVSGWDCIYSPKKEEN
jgi:hypothetical protein